MKSLLSKRLIIVLENPKYSGNVGSVARLVANFALDPIRIIGNPIAFEPDMEWMAYGAEEELAKVRYFEGIEKGKSDIDILIGTGMIHGKDRGKFIIPAEIPAIFEKTVGKIGIAFGREDRGLSRNLIDHCDYMVDFQLPGKQPSMNLSHSVGYLLGVICNSNRESVNEEKIPAIEKNHFYSYSKKIFDLLEMNDFHGSENLAVKRFKSILDSKTMQKGDLDFFIKSSDRLKIKSNGLKRLIFKLFMSFDYPDCNLNFRD